MPLSRRKSAALSPTFINLLFSALEKLYRRVCPTPLPTEWWLTTCDVVDVVSVQLCGAAFYTCPAKYLAPATLDKAAWLAPMLVEAIRLAKLNASAGLSARPTICQRPIYMALGLLETAARVDSHVASLLELDVIEAFVLFLSAYLLPFFASMLVMLWLVSMLT